MISEKEKKELIELFIQGKGIPKEIWEKLDKKEKKDLSKLQKKLILIKLQKRSTKSLKKIILKEKLTAKFTALI